MSAHTFLKMHFFRNLVTVMLLFFASGNLFAQVHIASETDIQGCEYLAEVDGSSGYGKNHNWQNLAKLSALNKAEQLTATHITMVNLHPIGAFNGVAIAKAYRCGPVNQINEASTTQANEHL